MRNAIVSAASRMFSAISFGVLRRDAPSTSAIIRSTNDSPGRWVIFTTIQKFAPAKGEKYPRLSERANIVVVADEAHRSQYGLEGKVDQKTGDIDYGFAKHLRDALPNASFVGFTGTPVEQADRNTPQVFGEYIDIYDIHRAVEDGATVKIYYEGRLAKLRAAGLLASS